MDGLLQAFCVTHKVCLGVSHTSGLNTCKWGSCRVQHNYDLIQKENEKYLISENLLTCISLNISLKLLKWFQVSLERI